MNWTKIFVCEKNMDVLCEFVRKKTRNTTKNVVCKSKKLYWCVFFVVFCEFVKKRMF